MATIQGVYVALFGRPADPAGLNYFNSITKNGTDLAKISNLSGQPEYTARFTGQTSFQIINTIYQSLFGRDADVAGLNFFADALSKGTLNVNNIAIAILDGAQGSDKTIVTNKVAAADLFTKSIDTTQEIVGYAGTSAAASAAAFLKTVTTTVPTQAQVDTAITASISASTGGGTGTAGATLTLTSGADFISVDQALTALKSTAGNDTFRAVTAGDLGTADSINGGAGTDTLNATMDATTATAVKPLLTSVENVNLTYGTLAASPTFDAADSAGILKLSVNNVTTANGFATVNVNNVEKATTVAFNSFTSAVASTANVVVKDVAGASDSATVSLEKVGGAASFTLAVAGIEKLAVNSIASSATGTTDTNTAVIKDAALQTLTVTGDKNITLTHDVGNIAVKTVDASALTGALTYTATNNGETITGGSKADTITLGTGADTLVYNKAGQSIAGGSDTINGFSAVNDKIDIKAFGIGADSTIKIVTTSPTADVAGFFTGTDRIAFNDTTHTAYIDANHDGNFNAASDLVITFDATVTGVNALVKGDFILA